MRLIIEMSKRVITLAVEHRSDDDGWRDSQVDSLVERPHPDDMSERAELDSRRRIGFAQTSAEPTL